MSQSSVIAATMNGELVCLRTLKKEKNTCHLAAIRLVTPQNTGYWPQIGGYIKEMISVSPGSFIFPYIEKC